MMSNKTVVRYLVWGMVLVSLLSWGCASMKMINLPHIPVREYLVRGDEPDPNFGAYGYLVFTKRASDKEKTRYNRICDSFKLSFELGRYMYNDNKNNLMVTFWPLEVSAKKEKYLNSCKWLLSKYDYEFANILASTVKKLSIEGPLLIAWDKPFGSGQAKYKPVWLDLSDFDDDDIDRAMLIWKGRIARDPANWNDGFNLVKFREAFRSLVQKYGEDILSVVQGS